MVKGSVNPPKLSLGEVIGSQWAQMLKLGGFVTLTALFSYIFSAYMSTFLTQVVGLGQGQSVSC